MLGSQPHTGAWLMHLPFISHGCSAEAGAEHGMASQGSDTCLVLVWAGEVALQSVRLPGSMCTPGWVLCSLGQECVLVLQDGLGSQGMGAVPRVGIRNHAEMPLGKSLGGLGIVQKWHWESHWLPATGTICGQLRWTEGCPHGWEGLHVWNLSLA